MKTESKLTHDESLAIITDMIQTTKGNLKEGSFYFLLWGWIVLIANLGHFAIIEFTNYPHPYYIWFITVIGWIISMIYGFRKSKKAKVRTYSDYLIMWIWIGLTICALIIIFSGQFVTSISALILLLVGMSTFISGLIIRFRPIVLGGASFWAFAIICLIVGPVYALLVSAFAIIVGYLIPGYLLKKSSHE